MSDELPLRKSLTLKERFAFAVTPEMKRDLETLRAHGVDHTEWLRQLIARELPKALEKAPRSA